MLLINVQDDLLNVLDKVEREYSQKSANNNNANTSKQNTNSIGFQFNSTSKFIVNGNSTPNVPQPKTKKTFLTTTNTSSNWISPSKTTPPPAATPPLPKPNQSLAQQFSYPAPANPPPRNYTPTKPPVPKSFKSPAFGENGSTTFTWNKAKTQRKTPTKGGIFFHFYCIFLIF